ncbi:Retrotransposon gag domain [Plasmopara halstedii]|uniref:Retrotransposon gag domain n=1 Tax=Plasmopara halstedii TaxID=4781 RepID=A0A0P1B6P7_PLAHL|nr:Retrotransposon gag domain [Plasmopara halstedii]CEG50062.1 Retrotransposon gag domain [Plasmopara halstedii]|eukprot:XP_024586431.1 Retrotransposon gag domain [Plasmopara halstedii]
MTPPSTTIDSFRPKLLMVSFKTFEDTDGNNLLLRVIEAEMAMASAMLQTEQQRVALPISKLGGQAREWALTCGTSVEAAFSSWTEPKMQLLKVVSTANQDYRMRSHFFAVRRGKKELMDFVKELRTLIVGIAADPLPEAVTVTVFVEGLSSGMAKIEVFHVHRSSVVEV